MSDDATPLSEEERAELEELRREKAERLQAERNRKERAELEELRREKAHSRTSPRSSRTQGDKAREERPRSQQAPRTRRVRTVSPEEARQIERDREVRERNAKLMEPDDDLSMPVGQKVVLIGIFAVAIIAILAIVFGPK